MFDLLLSLAGNASIRIGVPGHACPFIGRQPCDPASLISMAFHPTVVWLAFNFFVERPMARRRATSSPAWGGVSVMALLRFPFLRNRCFISCRLAANGPTLLCILTG